jgi:hypothetical protein
MGYGTFFDSYGSRRLALALVKRFGCAGLLTVALTSTAWASSVVYGYDRLGRIVTATYSTHDVVVKQIQYSYDKAGNRVVYKVCDGLCP